MAPPTRSQVRPEQEEWADLPKAEVSLFQTHYHFSFFRCMLFQMLSAWFSLSGVQQFLTRAFCAAEKRPGSTDGAEKRSLDAGEPARHARLRTAGCGVKQCPRAPTADTVLCGLAETETQSKDGETAHSATVSTHKHKVTVRTREPQRPRSRSRIVSTSGSIAASAPSREDPPPTELPCFLPAPKPEQSSASPSPCPASPHSPPRDVSPPGQRQPSVGNRRCAPRDDSHPAELEPCERQKSRTERRGLASCLTLQGPSPALKALLQPEPTRTTSTLRGTAGSSPVRAEASAAREADHTACVSRRAHRARARGPGQQTQREMPGSSTMAVTLYLSIPAEGGRAELTTYF